MTQHLASRDRTAVASFSRRSLLRLRVCCIAPQQVDIDFRGDGRKRTQEEQRSRFQNVRLQLIHESHLSSYAHDSWSTCLIKRGQLPERFRPVAVVESLHLQKSLWPVEEHCIGFNINLSKIEETIVRLGVTGTSGIQPVVQAAGCQESNEARRPALQNHNHDARWCISWVRISNQVPEPLAQLLRGRAVVEEHGGGVKAQAGLRPGDLGFHRVHHGLELLR